MGMTFDLQVKVRVLHDYTLTAIDFLGQGEISETVGFTGICIL
jgi:hypothetical protein